MNSRRNFIKKTGAGLAAAAFAPGVFAQAAEQEKIIIGIIGAENSHTAGFGKLFNIDKKFPGVEVKYVWGETDEFAKRAMERGNIPNQVKDPAEMMGRIDALIVDHRHPKYHLDAARPFVKAGIPAFIDKPFCYRAEKGKEFLQMARETGTPVTSYSSIAQSEATFDIKKQVENMGKIYQVIRTGPVNLDSEYGGVFFYGVHSVQPLMFMFGEDIERVRITRDGSYGNASLKFSGGLLATLVFKQKAYGWETFVETNDELIELKSRVEASNPPKNYVDMVEMFRTGKEPRSHQSILNGVSVLEALEESAETEKWVEVEYV
jgi:predicted dehydrogenase